MSTSFFHIARSAVPGRHAFRAVHLCLLLAVLLAGLACAPSAQATISCRALETGVERFNFGTWSQAANFYEVPVGGVITSATTTINTRIAKTGNTREEMYMLVQFISNGGGGISNGQNGYTMSGLPGLAVRMYTTGPSGDITFISNLTALVGSVVLQGAAVPDYRHVQSITVEIIREQETLPNGTNWVNSLLSTGPLPIGFSMAFQSAPNGLGSATICPTLNITRFNHVATGASPLPTTPPPAITCTLDINNGNPVVNFGSITLLRIASVSPGQPPTGFSKQSFDVRYHCENTPNTATPTYTLSWHGTPATGKPHALQVIQDNQEKAGVGIIMESESGDPPVVKVLELETGQVAAAHAGRTGGSSVKFHAYPIRTDNSAITPGSFKGIATIRLNLY